MKQLYIIFLLLILHIEVSSQSNTVPSIYYYSHDDSAFYIERADGTNKQMLAEFSLEPEWERIFGPGWSQSGQWFAWTKKHIGGSGGLQTANLVNRDGSRQIELVKDAYWLDMQWSPISDKLLLTWIEYPDEFHCENIMIYDFNTDLILYQSTIQELFDDDLCYGLDSQWSPNGDFISLTLSNKVATITPDGNILLIQNANWQSSQFSMWLPTNNLVFTRLDSNELVIYNLEDGSSEIFQAPNGWIRGIDWSPDLNYAIIYVSAESDITNFDAWLLSRRDNSLNFVVEDIVFNSEDERFSNVWNESNYYLYRWGESLLAVVDAETLDITNVQFENGARVWYDSSL